MASAAPLGWLNAVDFLHVDNRFAIPLVVEGGEVMCRFVPLLVNIGVASFRGARLRCKKKIGGDEIACRGFNGRGEKMPCCAAAFFIHACRWQRGIFDEVVLVGQIVLGNFRA